MFLVRLSAPTTASAPKRFVEFGGDAVIHARRRHRVTDGDHAGKFVTRHDRVGSERTRAVPDVQVGAADPSAFDLDEHLVRPWNGRAGLEPLLLWVKKSV